MNTGSKNKVDKKAERIKMMESRIRVIDNEIRRKQNQGRVFSLADWGPAES